MERNADTLLRRVREELRAEGPDGAGYSDFIILDAINFALTDLASIFTIRDNIQFECYQGENIYDLSNELKQSGIEIFNIIRVEYGGKKIAGKQIDFYLEKDILTEGPVKEWFLWGNKLILIGQVEDENINLWITRAPKRLNLRDDVPEIPSYADEALVAYAVSVCYRESKDYDRANYHYSIYIAQRDDILRKAIPQKQKSSFSVMKDSYMKPFHSARRVGRSDTNPGGR